jgi:hypothetical protein
VIDRTAYNRWIDVLTDVMSDAQTVHVHQDERVRAVLAQGAQFAVPIAQDVGQDDEPPNWMGW